MHSEAIPSDLAGPYLATPLVRRRIQRVHGESSRRLRPASRPKNRGAKDSEHSPRWVCFRRPEADLAWHVRAWGKWVHQKATADLEQYYPKIDGKPTVAYLWTRTVKCKNCAMIPFLKTKWLCKKDNKRVLL